MLCLGRNWRKFKSDFLLLLLGQRRNIELEEGSTWLTNQNDVSALRAMEAANNDVLSVWDPENSTIKNA
jgi:hypothetical protein